MNYYLSIPNTENRIKRQNEKYRLVLQRTRRRKRRHLGVTAVRKVGETDLKLYVAAKTAAANIKNARRAAKIA